MWTRWMMLKVCFHYLDTLGYAEQISICFGVFLRSATFFPHTPTPLPALSSSLLPLTPLFFQ